MVTSSRFALRVGGLAALCLSVVLAATVIPCRAATGPMFDNLVLVDEVVCGDPGDTHEFAESPAGASQTAIILGQAARVLPNAGDYPKYFAYRLAPGGVLQAGKAYILTLDYPEDAPRSMFVINSGCEQTYGFHTGATVGDALTPPYVSSNPESIQFPLSGEWESFEAFFHLHDRFFGIEEVRDAAVRPYVPADGFWVTVVQFGNSEDPLSAGAAISRIALYEAPDYETYALELNLPPAGLPHRHLFWREEMSDGVIGNTDPTMRGVAEDVTWYEYKARLMRFLGMNTFSKDLLEFGHNQGWDCTFYPGGWYNSSSHPSRWGDIIAMIGDGDYGLNILPYYEYCGSQGSLPDSLGKQRLCLPLTRDDAYTHIWWSETAYCDVTDERFVEEVAKLLDCTVSKVLGGVRPHDSEAITGSALGGANCWGYLDLGPDWQSYRIRATWTQSRKWHGGLPSPFAQLYWHHTPSQFLVSGAHVVPGDAIPETTLNFVTKYQSSEYTWQSDVMLPEGEEVTPAGRYLVFARDEYATEAQEIAMVGYIAGGDEQLQILPIIGGAQLRGTGDGWAPASYLIDNQPELSDTEVPLAAAWFRTRVSNMPVSFADAARARYGDDRNGGVAPTRAELQTNQMLYDDYLDWWNDERHAFLNGVRDVLRSLGYNDEADVLFTWDSSESGKSYPSFSLEIVTDDVATWQAMEPEAMVTDLDEALATGYHLYSLTTPVPNWGGWEWQHALPPPDVENYTDSDGVMMTYSFNKVYTVSSPAAFDAFRTASGLAAIRHYCLNEHALDEQQDGIVGYFVADMNYAGPYVMMGEARAVANGDPRYIGYLAGSDFNHPFPRYVRNFNANFLALPALPSLVLDAASDAEVVVRAIDAGSHGLYLAVVNTSLGAKTGMTVALPGGATQVTALATGETLAAPGGVLTLDMYPCQLLSLHIPGSGGPGPIPGDFNCDGTVSGADYVIWVSTFGNDGSPGKEDLRADANGDGKVSGADYVAWANNFGQSGSANAAPVVSAGNNTSITLPIDSVILHGSAEDDGLPADPGSLTLNWSLVSGPGDVVFSNPAAAGPSATFNVAGVYVLRLEAFDGQLTAADEVQVTVHPAPVNLPPEIDAGNDQTVQYPTTTCQLSGTVNDDGLPMPPNAVTVSWSKSSGPGDVSFSAPDSKNTLATFSVPGAYVLRLTAFDGELTAWDELHITINESVEPGQLYVITPLAWGPAVGSGYIPADGAFNAQPVWDDLAGEPVGLDPVPHSDTNTYFSDRFWYIDFGPNYAQYRIHQTWTRFRPYSPDPQPGFAGFWWDDDNDIENDNGAAETRINFCTSPGLPGVDAQIWVLNSDVSAEPVTPQGRYLVISTGPTAPSRANEFAIIGTWETAPLTVQSAVMPGIAAPATDAEDSAATAPPAGSREERIARRRSRLSERRQRALQRVAERQNSAAGQ